jgi:hypothetical protein
MDSYVQYVVNDNVSESQTAEQFFESQLPTYLQQLQTAQAALADYAAKHPGGSQDQRPLDEQIQIQQLTSAITQAQSQYTTATQKIEEARLSTETAKSDATQKLRVIDEPQTPSAPAPRITKAVTTVIVFMFVGFLLTCGAVVLGSVLDRSLRSADDVEELLQLPVLAVVPDEAKEIHRRDRRHKKKKRGERGDQAEPSRTERPQRPSIAPTGADARRGRGAARTPSADDRSRSSRGSAAVESTTGGSRNGGSSSKELS